MRAGILTTETALLRLVNRHLELHQNVAVQDVYKMLFQGVFGGEHLLADLTRAKAYLAEEWARVTPKADEPLIEPVSLRGEIVRINLRPCRADGFSADDVWQAFAASAGKATAANADFKKLWHLFENLCAQNLLPFAVDEVRQFGAEALAAGWPAKHHSPAYREANYPAYRVVRRAEWEKILAGRFPAINSTPK